MPFRSCHVPGRIVTGTVVFDPDHAVRGTVSVAWASLHVGLLR